MNYPPREQSFIPLSAIIFIINANEAMPSYQRDSPSPAVDLPSLEVPPVGQEAEYYFNLTPSLPPIGGKFAPVATAPVTTGNSDDDGVTTPPPSLRSIHWPPDTEIQAHRVFPPSGKKARLPRLVIPIMLKVRPPPLRRMLHHLRLPRTFLLTMLPLYQKSHS